MRKRLVTSYATQSSEAADENQRRIQGVFAELAPSKPGNVSYTSCGWPTIRSSICLSTIRVPPTSKQKARRCLYSEDRIRMPSEAVR